MDRYSGRRDIAEIMLQTPLTHSQTTCFLDSSKLKEFADDNFKFDQNSRKYSKRMENSVGKGEIARHEQFLLFQQCFQKTCTAVTEKQGLVLVGLNTTE